MSTGTVGLKVARWDAALMAVRGYLRACGMREVSTPVLTQEVALEPYIEPVFAGDALLITSPELWMKRLLCAGSGPIFQVAPVARAGEEGRRHAPQFHLVEWYRTQDARIGWAPASLATLQEDVERVGGARRRSGGGGAWLVSRPVRVRHTVAGLFEETCDAPPPAADDEECIRRWVSRLGAEAGCAPLAAQGPEDPGARRLWLWSALHAVWSDRRLDPWLARRPHEGVHIEGFPAPLAALSRVVDGVAQRTESYVGDVEISNGYVELRDFCEQDLRFRQVAALRRFHGQRPLPHPVALLQALQTGEGLPPCAGMALGLERTLMALLRTDEIAAVRPDLSG